VWPRTLNSNKEDKNGGENQDEMGAIIGWKRGEQEDVKKGEGNKKHNYNYVVTAV
jgi:hypothetical protein